MNRPKLEDYNFPQYDNLLDVYTQAFQDLEEYCDWLEFSSDTQDNVKGGNKMLNFVVGLFVGASIGLMALALIVGGNQK